jgi:N-acetylmuramoyl-L-alanine amidase
MTLRHRLALLACAALGWLALPVAGQELSALARLDPARSWIAQSGGGVDVSFAISQPVPWRVRVLNNPPRLVLDMREVDWSGLSRVVEATDAIQDMRAGVFRQGWSRLVMQLAGPMRVAQAEMVTSGAVPLVHLRLEPSSAADFAVQAALPEPVEWALPKGVDLPKAPKHGAGPLVVVLDPGHGGIDPGAERGGQTEADLVLTFAREFKEVLRRDGGFEVVMTRDKDEFVPLESRISIARAVEADVLISLHADAIAEGEAVGATIYTLSEDASDAAGQALAERHDRDDLLAGVDLSAQDDLVAKILMDMARRETTPRVERLAKALEVSIKAAGLKMHRHPHQEAGFSVLKSPDIPSTLVELGFLSSERDLKRLMDKDWRAKMAGALRDGLKAWAAEDAVLMAARQR